MALSQRKKEAEDSPAVGTSWASKGEPRDLQELPAAGNVRAQSTPGYKRKTHFRYGDGEAGIRILTLSVHSRPARPVGKAGGSRKAPVDYRGLNQMLSLAVPSAHYHPEREPAPGSFLIPHPAIVSVPFPTHRNAFRAHPSLGRNAAPTAPRRGVSPVSCRVPGSSFTGRMCTLTYVKIR